MIDLRFVPLEHWPDTPTKDRRPGQFRMSYPARLDQLEYELTRVGAHDIVVQAYFRRQDLRNDGWPRSEARAPAEPGVILSFRHSNGETLSFPCDRYETWQDNLHAITLSLEALRAVDRHGVTQRSEQYTGFRRLEAPAANSKQDELNREWAIGHLARLANTTPETLNRHPEQIIPASRAALKAAHPDHGGNVAALQLVQEAIRILRPGA